MGSGWHHAPASLVGAYKASVIDGKMYSKSGDTIFSSMFYDDTYDYAISKGTGFHMIDYLQHCTIGWMFMAKYKTRDSQSVCGYGGEMYYTEVPTGVTNYLGITDTTPDTCPSGIPNFLGLECPWGDIGEFMDGIHILISSTGSIPINNEGLLVYDKGHYSVNTPLSKISSPSKRVILPSGSGTMYGYSSKMYLGEYMDLVPTEYLGSSSTYWCDESMMYLSLNQNYTSQYIVRGVIWSAGNIYQGCYGLCSVPYVSDLIGCRLAFDGTITVIDDVNTFKSLPNL